MAMFYQFCFLFVAIAPSLSAADSANLTDLTEKVTSDLTPFINEIIKGKSSNPEMGQWFDRLKQRMQDRPHASPEDINELRQHLKKLQKGLFEYVTSPHYNLTSDYIIEEATKLLEPLLGILPMKELQQFYEFMQKNPQSAKMMDELSHVFFDKTAVKTKNMTSEFSVDFWKGFMNGFKEGVVEGKP